MRSVTRRCSATLLDPDLGVVQLQPAQSSSDIVHKGLGLGVDVAYPLLAAWRTQMLFINYCEIRIK